LNVGWREPAEKMRKRDKLKREFKNLANNSSGSLMKNADQKRCQGSEGRSGIPSPKKKKKKTVVNLKAS